MTAPTRGLGSPRGPRAASSMARRISATSRSRCAVLTSPSAMSCPSHSTPVRASSGAPTVGYGHGKGSGAGGSTICRFTLCLTSHSGGADSANDLKSPRLTYRRPRGSENGRRCCYLSSGLSPSAQEFHLVHRPLAAVGSRTLTAGSELHRSRSTCLQYAIADVRPLQTDSQIRLKPVRSSSISRFPQPAGAAPVRRGLVTAVLQLTAPQRQPTTADAAVKLITQAHKLGDPGVEQRAPRRLNRVQSA